MQLSIPFSRMKTSSTSDDWIPFTQENTQLAVALETAHGTKVSLDRECEVVAEKITEDKLKLSEIKLSLKNKRNVFLTEELPQIAQVSDSHYHELILYKQANN